MLDISYYEKTDEIIAQYTCEEKSLIPIIQGIQEEYRYLPPELLTYVAEKLGISEATLKVWQKKKDEIWLKPCNPAYEIRKLHPSRVKVQGILSGIVRKYH